MKKTKGLRGFITIGITRQQQINFIKRKNSFCIGTVLRNFQTSKCYKSFSP